MARRRKKTGRGIIGLALQSNWPVAASFAVLTPLIGFVLFPAAVAHTPLSALPKALNSLIWIGSGFFALTAAVKYLQSQKRASNQRAAEYVAREDMQLHLGRIVASANASTAAEPAQQRAAEKKRPTRWSLQVLQDMEWKRFEDLCAEYCRAKGIHSVTTSLGADGGVDIRLYEDADDPTRCTAIAQCKAWGDRIVGVRAVRELRGVMAHEQVEQAFFMTSGSYSEEATTFARQNHITLLDGELLLELIQQLPANAQKNLLDFATRGDWTTPSCPRCGTKMVERSGRTGRFWGCSNYPQCRQILGMRGEGWTELRKRFRQRGVVTMPSQILCG
ncbi:restriction endonuclease [Uliginosibacterium sp. H1]|uniref:restriction endonuclease n=1 Tax=Uliginosibacterium sp. H1 TaxID=3114757 RepID=UPI002E18F2F9|nr:restriction endonuclease [Uliginosibacterium sp. H1]